jgi:uroporphyrinogen-III synthase
LPDHESSRVLEALRSGEVDCVTFTSSSTVTNFLRMFARDEILPVLDGVAIACIGPITAKTAQQQGLTVTVTPTDYTIPALAAAVRDHFAKRPRRSSFRG